MFVPVSLLENMADDLVEIALVLFQQFPHNVEISFVRHLHDLPLDGSRWVLLGEFGEWALGHHLGTDLGQTLVWAIDVADRRVVFPAVISVFFSG